VQAGNSSSNNGRFGHKFGLAWYLRRKKKKCLVRIRAGKENQIMLYWSLLFFIIALTAAVLGFTGIAAAAAGIAKFIFFVFVVLFLIFLVSGVTARRRP
jgi:uncharacterized membrane protein YtjA (UPF0391 family)